MFHYRRQRSLPLGLTLSSCFGGALNVVGWFLLGFGLIFVRIFVSDADFEGLFTSYDARTQGIVIEVEATRASEGGSKRSRGRTIYRYVYRYSVSGRELGDSSYSSTSSFSRNERVTVEYSRKNPSLSRIAGTRAHIFGPVVAFVLIFPLVALSMLGCGLWRGWKASMLLREGVLTKGKLIERRRTAVTVNRKPVVEYVFAFSSMDGVSREAVVRTNMAERILDEEHESLMYHPSRPHEAMLLDDMPVKVRFAPDGSIESYESSFFWIAVPLLVIGGHLLAGF